MARLLGIDPGIKGIVSSGYADDPIMADFQKYGFSGVFAKPYKISELGGYYLKLPGKSYDHFFMAGRKHPAAKEDFSIGSVSIPKSSQMVIICHSERSEESPFLSRRDASLREAPFKMTRLFIAL